MTAQRQVETKPGIFWSVLSDLYPHECGCVVIPVNTLAHFNDAELGAYTRKLVRDTKFVQALNFAANIIHSGEKHTRIGILTEYRHEIHLLRLFAGEDENIDRARAIIDQLQERQEARERAPQIRRELATDYSDTFIAIGRRDGFACRHCGEADPDLQIDHIHPVARGGTNDLDNLQLLCPTCNRNKSDKLP